MADTPPVITLGHATSFQEGEDAPLVARLQKPPTSPIANGTAFVAADITAITWTLYRNYKGEWSIVADHSEIALVVADVMEASYQGWDRDSLGYNFRHLIDETELAPEATYRSHYDFSLTSGESFVLDMNFDYVGLFDEGEVPSEQSGSGGGGDPTDTRMLFSLTDAVTVSNTLIETTLLEGPATISADTWAEDEKVTVEAAFNVSTIDTGAGTLTLRLKLSTDMTLEWAIPLLGDRNSAIGNLRAVFTRRTDGASGLVTCAAIMQIAGLNNDVPMIRGTTSPVTVSSEAAKSFAFTALWSVADAGNSITKQSFTGEKAAA